MVQTILSDLSPAHDRRSRASRLAAISGSVIFNASNVLVAVAFDQRQTVFLRASTEEERGQFGKPFGPLPTAAFFIPDEAHDISRNLVCT